VKRRKVGQDTSIKLQSDEKQPGPRQGELEAGMRRTATVPWFCKIPYWAVLGVDRWKWRRTWMMGAVVTGQWTHWTVNKDDNISSPPIESKQAGKLDDFSGHKL
jgi:hypothetical protein